MAHSVIWIVFTVFVRTLNHHRIPCRLAYVLNYHGASVCLFFAILTEPFSTCSGRLNFFGVVFAPSQNRYCFGAPTRFS